MSFQVNQNEPLPAYYQMAEWMKDQIRDGKYPPGSRLPSHAELIKQTSLSYHTVRKALSCLVDEKLVTAEHGRGIFVRAGAAQQAAADPQGEKSHRIAAILPWSTSSIFASVLSGIEEVAHQQGYQILLLNHKDEQDVEMAKLREVMEHRVDGIVWAIPESGANLAMMRKVIQDGVPVVLVDRKLPELETDFVGTDNVRAMRSVVEHLLERNCRRLAYIRDSVNISATRERLEGLHVACKEFGLPAPEVFCTRKPSRKNGAACGEKILRCRDQFDAVVCQTDLEAAGFVDIARRQNVSIPDEIKLAGFDDEVFAGFLHPPLTTVHQDFEQIGRTGTELLLGRISGELSGHPTDKRIPAWLVERLSTGPGVYRPQDSKASPEVSVS